MNANTEPAPITARKNKAGKIKKISLPQKFKSINTVWQPYLLQQLQGIHIRADKMIGPFFWQHHQAEDTLYFVHTGLLLIQQEKKPDIQLEAGEMAFIPRGTRYRLAAHRTTEVIILCPESTINTGDQENEFTRQPDKLKII